MDVEKYQGKIVRIQAGILKTNIQVVVNAICVSMIVKTLIGLRHNHF